MLLAKPQFQTYLAPLVNKTWLSKGYKDRFIIADIRVAFLLTYIELKIVLTHT